MNFLVKRKKENERRRVLHENGSLLLEELVSSSDGICHNPIRAFSSDQILKATNDFDSSCIVAEDGLRFIWFKGMVEDRCVPINRWAWEPFVPENIYREIVVSSSMSGHKNVLKLLGCCLEFCYPVLVYEYAEKGALTSVHRGEFNVPLPWNIRLKIAKEITSTVTYLHITFPRTIVHRDITPRNIFLDENWTSKLSSFSFSISIPEGELGTYDTVCATTGHIEPDYCRTGLVTENVDVYGFGYSMLALLAGKSKILQGSKIKENRRLPLTIFTPSSRNQEVEISTMKFPVSVLIVT